MGSEATYEFGAEAGADAAPSAPSSGRHSGSLGAAVGGAVDERRLAVGPSLDFGATDDATPGPDADEATTIEIGGDEV